MALKRGAGGHHTGHEPGDRWPPRRSWHLLRAVPGSSARAIGAHRSKDHRNPPLSCSNLCHHGCAGGDGAGRQKNRSRQITGNGFPLSLIPVNENIPSLNTKLSYWRVSGLFEVSPGKDFQGGYGCNALLGVENHPRNAMWPSQGTPPVTNPITQQTPVSTRVNSCISFEDPGTALSHCGDRGYGLGMSPLALVLHYNH